MIGRRIDNLFPRTRGAAGTRVALSVEGLSTAAKLGGRLVRGARRRGARLLRADGRGTHRTGQGDRRLRPDHRRARSRSTASGCARTTPGPASALGIGLLTEDRKTEGLMARTAGLPQRQPRLASAPSPASASSTRRTSASAVQALSTASASGRPASVPADQEPVRRQPAEGADLALADARPRR